MSIVIAKAMNNVLNEKYVGHDWLVNLDLDGMFSIDLKWLVSVSIQMNTNYCK